MKLHKNIEEFNQLATLTAKAIGVPEVAVKKDYYIVKILDNLAKSEYKESCIFKGGTSLSKCYPSSIERFSEDIDLTFFPKADLSEKQYDRALKNIEQIMVGDGNMEKIGAERNNRNKSSYVWYDNEFKDATKVKLEIGSSVSPDPYEVRQLKSYIQEYLESIGRQDVIEEYGLHSVSLNTLCIERTFIDKVMSIKRHAICGTIDSKVRHIYDVVKLYERKDIQTFLQNTESLKDLLVKTKETDSFYLDKRNIAKDYNPLSPYDFNKWKEKLDATIKKRYESLHLDLLYTDEKQDFNKALEVLSNISKRFSEIGE
ncbi:MAG: nucleotidyl transferase AbiEii/AbiGii toxin family protein [Clostridia bacterium]|nr:nucleotidyl transferase AbiEii/AbiGii toxin family protein [Clostridia bacterium]